MSAVAPEHPHGRNDPDELAVAGLVENPANLVNLLANLNRKAARSLLRREDLRALVDLELGMIEQDVECVEERSATLVAVLRGAAHHAPQTIGAFGRDEPCWRLGPPAARDLVRRKNTKHVR